MLLLDVRKNFLEDIDMKRMNEARTTKKNRGVEAEGKTIELRSSTGI